MADLKEEYTDIRGITHKVEHVIVPPDGRYSREQILEELVDALTRPEGDDHRTQNLS